MAEPAAHKLGVALVGLGSYSSGQLGPALRETKLCRLAGVVTGSPAKAARWAKNYGLPSNCLYTYDTMERMAENPAIDIVYVVTPNGLHAEHAIRAARAGKHVICEKPMANTVAECDAMIAACRAAGRKLAIGYRQHYHTSLVDLALLARDRRFGDLMKMNGAFAFRTWNKTWRQTQKLGGGGPLMDLGIYILQEACVAAGATPVAVTAKADPVTRPDVFDEVEETLRFTLEFPNGARCEGRTSYNDSYNHFRAEGAKGWIELEPAFAYHGITGRTNHGQLRFPDGNQQAAQMDDFAACILESRESIVPGEMGRRDLQLIEAIYRAMRSGQREPV
jgi:glucose-fructose oxidoreductase